MHERLTFGVPAGSALSPSRRLADVCILVLSTGAGVAATIAIASPSRLLFPMLGIAAGCVLVAYPELALAAYVVVGDVKGNESVASLIPVDLTVVVGAVLLAGMIVNLLRGRRPLQPPAIYFLFAALVTLMAASLAYTPVFAAGLDKFARFLTVTGVVIIGPFFVLNTPAAMKRFLIGFSVATFAICAWSLSALGGNDRLASPSDNTIGLGHIACGLFVVIWIGVVSRYSFPRRAIAYPLLAVAGLALIGSASRGSVIACVLVVAISILGNRRLLLDVACLGSAAIAAIPIIGIPGSSISYLASIVRSHSVGDLLNFRGDLLAYGWRLFQRHPFFGAGLSGFRERLSPHHCLSQIVAALLLVGIINAINTGDINSDRSTWLFISLVFAVGAFRPAQPSPAMALLPAPGEG